MYTEEEAKVRWCPFARVGVYAGTSAVSVNRHPDPDVSEDTLCLTSGCMAWKWHDKQPKLSEPMTWWPETDDDAVLRAGEPPRPSMLPERAVWVPWSDEDGCAEGAFWCEPEDDPKKRFDEETRKRRGYCGLAGRPE